MGGGASIGEKPLHKAGRPAVYARPALTQAAEALTDGRVIPDEAEALMAKPAIWKWLYLFMGLIGWRLLALKNRAGSLCARPYQQ